MQDPSIEINYRCIPKFNYKFFIFVYNKKWKEK
jgi:hypothetical protein